MHTKVRYTVGFRVKKEVAQAEHKEWSSGWRHTNYYDDPEQAEEQKQEWQRNKKNDAVEFKVLEVGEE